MPTSALALVLVAAMLHATWNLVLKRSHADPAAFAWLSASIGALVWAPIALGLHGGQLPQWSAGILLAVLTSGILHVGYFLLLQTGYRRADLSVVYPVARGLGPLLSALVAIPLLDESFGPLTALGLAAIVAGTLTIAGGVSLLRGRWSARMRAGLGWGAATGVLIAAYTINDGHAVRVLGAAPVLFYWASETTRALLLTPVAALRPQAVRAVARAAWRSALLVGVLSPLAYMLVLQAMTLAPISHVAPARELSMLIAALLGARLLGEGEWMRRLSGSALIAGGVACLTLAR